MTLSVHELQQEQQQAQQQQQQQQQQNLGVISQSLDAMMTSQEELELQARLRKDAKEMYDNLKALSKPPPSQQGKGTSRRGSRVS